MFADIINVLILAVLQGLTEFLPVSSSGHLVLAEAFLGGSGVAPEGSLIFEIAVHVGTLGAVVAVYRGRIASMVKALSGWAASGFSAGEGEAEEIRFAGLIILGSLPAAFAGIFLRDGIAGLFDSPEITSAFLVITGIFLLFSKGKPANAAITWKTALIIGAAQAVAIIPGCSRSGWTITAALLAGVGFEKAAEYSFILSVPAILGALLLEIISGSAALTWQDSIYLAIAVSAAFVSGVFALRLLVYLLGKGRLYRFSWYLIPAGALSLIYFLISG